MTEPLHPVQPLVNDPSGVVRFKANAIARYLLDNGGYDMNDLATLPVSDEDRAQFAQLIGYSLSGFGDLSYVSDEMYQRAARRDAMTPDHQSQAQQLVRKSLEMLTPEDRAAFIVENIEDASLREDVRTRALAAIYGTMEACASVARAVADEARASPAQPFMNGRLRAAEDIERAIEEGKSR